MAIGELWEKIKEQEVVDYRLLIAAPIVLVLGLVALIYFNSGSSGIGDRNAPGLSEQVYTCHYDQTEVNASGEDLFRMQGEGDAIIGTLGAAPTRIRCTKCNRMSCFAVDAETGDPVEVDPDWDLSEEAQTPSRTPGGASR